MLHNIRKLYEFCLVALETRYCETSARNFTFGGVEQETRLAVLIPYAGRLTLRGLFVCVSVQRSQPSSTTMNERSGIVTSPVTNVTESDLTRACWFASSVAW